MLAFRQDWVRKHYLEKFTAETGQPTMPMQPAPGGTQA